MANDMKSGVGFIIPAAGVIGFFTSLFMGEFLTSIIVAVSGILVWFLYMVIMESHIPNQMGNMIILFGIMLAVGIFMGFGINQNMWGGIEFNTEGSIFALIILFFSVLTGLSFRNQPNQTQQINNLTESDKNLVMNAIKKTKEGTDVDGDPRVIVIQKESDDKDNNSDQYDTYNMMSNLYASYPYYDEYEDYEDEDYEDEDYEDEDYEDED